MKRRPFLTGISVSVGLLAGCLVSSDDEVDGSSDGTDNGDNELDESGGCISSDTTVGDGTIDYERCPHRIVRLSDLPAAAESEALAALGEVRDGIVDLPRLPMVISVDESYLLHDDSYYRVELTESDDQTQLCLTEALPIFTDSVVLENWMDTAVTVGIHLEHEETNEVLVEKTVELDVDDRVSLNDEVDFPYGTYAAEFSGDDLSGDGMWETTLELNWAYETGNDYPVQLDDHGVFIDPVARNSMFGPCSWDEDGNVSTGNY